MTDNRLEDEDEEYIYIYTLKIIKNERLHKLSTSNYPHHQEDTAVGLFRGGYRSRGIERPVPGRQLAVYSRGGAE